MKNGPVLVISGTLVGSMLLSFFLLTATAGAAIPSQPDLRAESAGANLADEIPGPLEAQGSAHQQNSDPADDCQLSHRFPAAILQWCDLITHYAEKRGLSPDLVAALIWQESGGDPQAYSHSGAVGLMQVMPSDGLAASFTCANGPCFSSRPTTAQLQDPEFNVSFGTKMLAGLIRRNGNMREGLRAYGPMSVGYSYADKVMGIYQKYGNQE